MANGIFTISLDFELYWGLRDKRRLDEASVALLGGRKVIPNLLQIFREYDIHGTWAVVGLLFFSNRSELLANLPELRPNYVNSSLDPYRHIDALGKSETEDPFHYANTLIRIIAKEAGQEIATHTFSHYYCLEPGQTVETFRADLKAAIEAAARLGITLRSIVFPKNQFNPDYLESCKEMGIQTFRGSPDAWMYRPANSKGQTRIKRLGRFLDAYINLSANNVTTSSIQMPSNMLNIPATRFLRPVRKSIAFLEPLRLRRIQSEMEIAAKKGGVYHLWWHPHNFGEATEENLAFLRKILDHYQVLRETYGFSSLNMREIADTKYTDQLAMLS